MKKTFRFLKFKVYEDSKVFYRKIVLLTKKYPRVYWELGDQLRRSALSVILNIAEGSGKDSDRDFNRYLNNSLGSINESAACLDVACSEKLISIKQKDILVNEAKQIADQLGGFSKKLRSS